MSASVHAEAARHERNRTRIALEKDRIRLTKLRLRAPLLTGEERALIAAEIAGVERRIAWHTGRLIEGRF